MALAGFVGEPRLSRAGPHIAAWHRLATQAGIGGLTANSGQTWGGFGFNAIACWASVTCWLAAAAAATAVAETVE